MESLIELLDRVDEYCEKATEGPWFVAGDKAMDCGPHADSGLALVDTGRESDWTVARLCEWPTAQFIAQSRTDLPRLSAALREMMACEPIDDYHARCDHNAVSEVWKALGITGYTGKAIWEHVREMMGERDALQAELKAAGALVRINEAMLDSAERDVSELSTCWHCGVILAEAPKPRCEDCPDECDAENCDAMGCAALAATEKE